MTPKPFTIMELVIVMAIMALVAGFVITRIGHTPAFVTLGDSVNRIKSVFLEASSQALVQAKDVKVNYSIKGRRLTVAVAPKQDDELINSDKKLKEKLMSYGIPKGIEVSFEGEIAEEEASDEDVVTFCFYSDGSADGPAMTMSLKGHEMIVTISQLTGMVNVEEVEEAY